MKRRYLIVISIILLIAAFRIAVYKTHMHSDGIKSMIFSYVLDNNSDLDECIHNKEYTSITAFNGHSIKPTYRMECVEFFCCGEGIGPDGIYYGFYYSPDDHPHNFEYELQPLQKNDDGYLWVQEKGNCYFYTERILPFYYYYEYAS